MHVLINCFLSLTVFILLFYGFFVSMRLTGRYMDRKQDRLMFRSQYVDARNQRKQMELVVAKEPWLQSQLRESLIEEMDALEKYLRHRGKRSHKLESQGRFLAKQINIIDIC